MVVYVPRMILGVGVSAAVCDTCCAELYEVCQLCGLFQSKTHPIVGDDPFIIDAHAFQKHVFVAWSSGFVAEKQFDDF
jgi:hypothetical protein